MDGLSIFLRNNPDVPTICLLTGLRQKFRFNSEFEVCCNSEAIKVLRTEEKFLLRARMHLT